MVLICGMTTRNRVDVSAPAAAIREVIQVHVHLSASLDCTRRVAAEASADGVGDDAEALAELVDEAEGELAVTNGGSDEEDSRNLRGLVLVCQQRRAGEAALRPVGVFGKAEEMAGRAGDARGR